MARALGAVHPEEVRGLGEVTDEPAGYRYGLEARADHVALVETRSDSPGHRLESPLAFAIGAGVKDRSYAAIHGSSLWFAPLEVVSTAGGRHAALAPGHTITPGTRLGAPITPECLGCHTDSPPPLAYPLNLRPDPAVWQPTGISCAACHGAVDEHVAWQDAELSGVAPAGPDPVLRSADLSRVERLSICAACHLQGDARIVLDPGELGPPPPGHDLLERRALFVAAEPNQEIGFVSHVERLVLSPCFLASETMDCATCHDPHRGLHEESERRQVRAACLACHAGPEEHEPPVEAGLDCVGCHMRTTGAFDVAEVEITDHFIRRDPGESSPPGPLRFPEAPDGEWRRFTWPGEPEPDHVDDPGLWLMAWSFGGHAERAITLVDRAPGPVVAALPMYHHVRGSLLEELGRPEDAARSYRRALALHPGFGPSTTNLGLLLGSLGRGDEGLALLDELLGNNPAADAALRNRAVLRYRRGDLAGFAADLERAFELVPRAELAATLASFHAQGGDGRNAAAWRRRAEELDPASFGNPPD